MDWRRKVRQTEAGAQAAYEALVAQSTRQGVGRSTE